VALPSAHLHLIYFVYFPGTDKQLKSDEPQLKGEWYWTFIPQRAHSTVHCT